MSRSEGTGDGQARRAVPEKGYWAEIYERYHQEVRARFVGRVPVRPPIFGIDSQLGVSQ